ncbi:OmpA family protein [Povalibacter sp.]|uniref:OmpA family protein n=1 Tax=Povalibacter sp. TaxID=1962978 RepID=UPI002F3ED5D5
MIARLLLIACSALACAAQAADIAGSKDHPMITRYAGSEIIKYDQRAFDGTALIKAPIRLAGGRARNPDSYLPLEGKLTRVAYRAPEGRSVLEVFRNYEQALRDAGFEILFTCENEPCGARQFNQAATPQDLMTLMGYNEKDQRYLLAKLVRPEGDVHVSLYVDRAYSVGGQNKDRIFANLIVIESQPMQAGLVTVDAAAMAKGLAADGHIALYEIYFDTDKADLEPESATALGEVAKLLKTQPALKVLIVGHTDNAGALDYNRSLSERRAQSVVDALAKQHAVARDRLTAVGVGMAAPVASNDSDSGRAKNRRVELVKR